jgi:hypothetical protein
MATISPVGTWIARGVHKTLWETMTGSGDTANPESAAKLPDKTIQVFGTFESATITIQGSNDGGTTYVTLNDPQGNALTFTANKTETILENPELIRPTASGATGGTDVDIILISYGSSN